MTPLPQFILTNNGHFLDFDNKYGNQCVDLFRFYNQEVLGIPQPKGVAGAKDFWNLFSNDAVLKENFEKIVNTAEFVPKAGDVMIWGHGEFGHIAIVATDQNTTSQFTAFSQNDPTGSPCKLIKYSYKNCLGVLRPKKGSMSAEMYPSEAPHLDLNNKDSVKVAVDVWVRLQKGEFIDKLKYEADLAAAKKEGDDRVTLQREQFDKEKAEAVEKAREEGFEAGKQSVPAAPENPVLPNQPPEVIKLDDNSEWIRNGLQYSEGKLVGNYQRKPAI